jgi:hypothetical protein
MDTYRIPGIAEVITLSHEDAVSLYEAIVPVAAILRARIVAQGELARPAAPTETREQTDFVRRHVEQHAARGPVGTDIAELEDVEITVERINDSGRVVFDVPGRGLVSAIPTSATRRRFSRLKPGQVVRVHRAEVATLPRSGGRQVLRRVTLS